MASQEARRGSEAPPDEGGGVLAFVTGQFVAEQVETIARKRRRGRDWVDDVLIILDNIVDNGLVFVEKERLPWEDFKELNKQFRRAGGDYEWRRVFKVPWRSLLEEGRLQALRELERFVDFDGYTDVVDRLARAFKLVVEELRKHAAKVMGLEEGEITRVTDFKLVFRWAAVKTVRLGRERFKAVVRHVKYDPSLGFLIPLPPELVERIAEDVLKILGGDGE